MVNSKALGLTGGILWGAGLFILTLISIWSGYAQSFLAIIDAVYPGYSITYAGSFIGLIYGFVDAFVGLWIFGAIYNMFARRMR